MKDRQVPKEKQESAAKKTAREGETVEGTTEKKEGILQTKFTAGTRNYTTTLSDAPVSYHTGG